MQRNILVRLIVGLCVAAALVLAGCGGDNGDGTEPATPDPTALEVAKNGAAMAAAAAMTASTKATAEVEAVEDNRNYDAASYVAARDAAADAMAAHQAAMAASKEAAAAADAGNLDDAQMYQAAAEDAQEDVEDALADAQMYAGMVTQAKMDADAATAAAAEAAALSAAQTAAMDAATAAKTASDAAAAAVSAQMANMDADPDSYAAAQAAAQAAMDAYMAAKAASESAAMAMTSADAMMHQATAETDQENAETAYGNAKMYANMVMAAKELADADAAAAAVAAEMMALADARTVADTAADMAEMAASAAQMAVSDVMDIADADQASYDMATAAAQTAMDAATAARDASDAAVRATTSADAEMHQATAMMKQGEAESARTDAMSYAGMVTQAKMDADVVAAEMYALNSAKEAAQTAHDAAKMAADNAAAAVMAVEGSKDLSTTTAAAFARAEDARDEAAAALLDAIAANSMAQAAMNSEEAKMHQADAEAAQRVAHIAYTSAMGYADVVSQQQMMADDAADEATMLTNAQDAASDAAMDARTAADSARDAADKVAELAGSGSAAAIRADMLATEAENAATAAETASMNAAADMSSADAEMERMAAVGGKTTAEGNLMTLTDMQHDAQVAHDTTQEQLEIRDLADAQDAAQDAADEAMTHYIAAKGKAEMARNRANAARAAANRAKTARMDYANADKYAKVAEAAASRAGAALARAMQANTDAAAAAMAASEATTSEVAKAEQMKAEAANDIATEAHTGDTGAGMAYMAAKDAAEKAVEAGPVHVRALLIAANATSMSGAAKAVRVTEVAGAIATAAAVVPTGTVSATWMGDTVDNPDTEDADESADGMLRIAADVDGSDNVTPLKFRTAFVADTDLVMTGNQPGAKTATEIDGLPGFPIGYDISEDGVHAIVFTNKEQGADSTFDTPVSFTNRLVTNLSRIVRAAPETPITLVGTNLIGAAYDHDGNSDTDPLTIGTGDDEVTISCSVMGECTYQLESGELVGILGDGRLTATYSDTIEAALAMDSMDYLIFGVWLNEGAAENSPTSGAFSGGGRPFPTAGSLVGKATYNGSAAGLYTEGTNVDFFSADATLTADFGKIDADEGVGPDNDLGTITGRIDDIVAGGRSMSDVILLNSDADGNIDAAGTFDGMARMGTPTITGDVAKYDYSGVWEGDFLGAPMAAGATGVDRLPPAVSGTFGVTGTDDMGTAADMSDDVIRSYVGAFGAER